MQAPKRFGSTTLAAGGPGWDGMGVRLAQLRGEQASNTNQGDLVMDIGLTERALCWVVGLDQLLPSHTSHVYSALSVRVPPFSSLVTKQKKEYLSAANADILCIPTPVVHTHLSSDMTLQSPLTEKHQLAV